MFHISDYGIAVDGKHSLKFLSKLFYYECNISIGLLRYLNSIILLPNCVMIYTIKAVSSGIHRRRKEFTTSQRPGLEVIKLFSCST